MNKRVRYYQGRIKSLLLYIRTMPDLRLRTALFLGSFFLLFTAFLLGAAYSRENGAKDAVAVVGAIPFVEYPKVEESLPSTNGSGEGEYVAARTSGVYYNRVCKGWSRIGKSNRVWFGTREEAEAAGYAPAKSCKK